MSVTNTIRDDVTYKDDVEEWFEDPLTNDEIIAKLESEKKKAFLSFAYGVWCTSWARDCLIRRIMALDEYMIYADTDSLKLLPNYNKKILEDYNKSVEERIKFVSSILKIPFEKYAPEDIKGERHLLGIFEYEGHLESFITQGAKKYAYIKWEKNSKIKADANILEKGEENSKILEITVAGVPKKGSQALHSLDEFRDDFVFDYKDTGKNLLVYVENQEPFLLKDYNNKESIVKDKSGCSLIPTTYVLGKALDYANLVNDNSSKRAVYKE